MWGVSPDPAVSGSRDPGQPGMFNETATSVADAPLSGCPSSNRPTTAFSSPVGVTPALCRLLAKHYIRRTNYSDLLYIAGQTKIHASPDFKAVSHSTLRMIDGNLFVWVETHIAPLTAKGELTGYWAYLFNYIAEGAAVKFALTSGGRTWARTSLPILALKLIDTRAFRRSTLVASYRTKAWEEAVYKLVTPFAFGLTVASCPLRETSYTCCKPFGFTEST